MPIDPGTFTSGPLALRDAALFTDLYEITMAASYFRERMTGAATFSLFVRQPGTYRVRFSDRLVALQHAVEDAAVSASRR